MGQGLSVTCVLSLSLCPNSSHGTVVTIILGKAITVNSTVWVNVSAPCVSA